jgi:hypothetical protein
MTLSFAAQQELAAQETGTAWLVLITLDHPDLDTPIRVTSDSIETISNGNVFAPFPFEVTLPDDVEGRTPQAQLKIDNTSQEVIALLRGLASPPSVTLQIVRSADPNVVEREWTGIEWRASTYDLGTITGTLTVDDLATEEFPYVTFDGRFKGLWP